MGPLNISSLPRGLRGVAREADANRDGTLTKPELTAYQQDQRASWQRPAFIIGDLFPFLDPATRHNRGIEKNLAKADDLMGRLDAVG